VPADGDAGPLVEDLFPCDTKGHMHNMHWVIFHWLNLSPTPFRSGCVNAVQGAFGTVWKGTDRKTGNVVAIKQMSKAPAPWWMFCKRNLEVLKS